MLCKGVGVPVCVCVGVCVICVHAYVAFKMLLVNPLSNYVTMLRIQSSSSGSLNEWMGYKRTNERYGTAGTGPYACRTNGNDQFGLFRSLLVLGIAIKVILGVTFYTGSLLFRVRHSLLPLCVSVCERVVCLSLFIFCMLVWVYACVYLRKPDDDVVAAAVFGVVSFRLFM